MSAIDPNAPYFQAGQVIVVALPPAQIKALAEVPAVLVPAQGANTVVVVDRIVMQLVFGTVAYAGTGSNDLLFAFGANGAAQIWGASSADLLDSTGALLEFAPFWADSIATNLAANQAVTLSNTSSDYTNGNGTLLVKTYFSVEMLPLRV